MVPLRSAPPAAPDGPTDIPEPVARVEAMLTAPDGPFATEEILVLGEPMRVFKRRLSSLRALVERARGFGDAEALVFSDGTSERRYSFAAVVAEVAAVAAGLRARGVGPGDRVAIAAANGP